MNIRKRSTQILAATLALALTSAALAALRPIGSQRQFFFDDNIVETMDNTMRRLNPAVKLADNPVIKADKPWEGPDTRMSFVMFDHRLGKFRMRYSSGVFKSGGRNEKGEVIVLGEGDGLAKERVVCEAFSDDGVNWVKPELGLVEFQGSKANNILPAEANYGYLFEDLHDPDPARRYKALVREGSYSGVGMTFSVFVSADAYHWTPIEENPVIDTGEQPGRWGPTEFLGWDPIRQTYAVHMENNFHMHSPYLHRRSIGRAESPDMIHWSEPETIIVVDERDYPDTEFYHFPVEFHEGWYLGFLWIFSTTNTTHEPAFAFSRDGVNYDRTYRDPIIRRGDNGAFDSVSIYAQKPLIHDGEILCYYTGTNWRSPEQLVELGDKATAGIGLARLPLDGFVSLEGARHDFSVVTTRSFTFTGKNLFLNMQAALQQWGAEPCEVKVELLDGRHAPVAGFAFADADTLTTTDLNQLVTWQGKADVSALEGKPIRLRIHFKNAKLYAFQFR
jgi:hypothetical protein